MAVRLLIDHEGNVVNRILLEFDAVYDSTPYALAPAGVDGKIGGTYINGVYTAPPEPEEPPKRTLKRSCGILSLVAGGGDTRN